MKIRYAGSIYTGINLNDSNIATWRIGNVNLLAQQNPKKG